MEKNVRYNPHFHSLGQVEILILILILITVTLFFSYIRKRNTLALILGSATLFIALSYISAFLPVILIPSDINTQIWYANVVGEMLTYTGVSYFILAVLVTNFQYLPPSLSLVALATGLTVVIISALKFTPPTLLPDGNYDFHRLLLADITPFIAGIIMTYELGKFLLNNFKYSYHKFASMCLASGILITSSSMTLDNVTPSVEIIDFLQITANIGLFITLVGLWSEVYFKQPAKR